MTITQTPTMARWQIIVKMSEATKQTKDQNDNKKQTNKQIKQNNNNKPAEGACVFVCVCARALAQLRTYDANYAVIVVPLSNYAVDIWLS